LESDGSYCGGCIQPANNAENRRDHRLARIATLALARRHRARPLWQCGPCGVPIGRQALAFVKARIARRSMVHADEGNAWDALLGRFEMKRINHEEAYPRRALARTKRKAASPACAAPRSATMRVPPTPICSATLRKQPARGSSHIWNGELSSA